MTSVSETPRIERNAFPEPVDRAPQTRSGNQAVLFTGCRILVVDDDPINRQVAARMLEKLGCSAEVAGDGHEALRMHRAQRYDLLLMDCQMPELDGYQTTAHIRAMENTALRTPVIALSAGTMQAEREKCLAAGMDDFLPKPLQPQALKDSLARWVPSFMPNRLADDRPDDQDQLESVRAMFGDDFAGLARLFRTESPKRIGILRQAEAAKDHAQMAKVAHAFSGSCASIGAKTLAALCKELELSAKAGRNEDFEMKLAGIEAEYHRIDAKLRSMIPSI